ncbi:MAG: hypothetical protein IPQ16_08020 [Geobacteraceae bacterium]|nr:hypothetical protein [Geobacteraceae bacterium]
MSMHTREVDISFSLDPARNIVALADDISTLSREMSIAWQRHATANSTGISSLSAELAAVARDLKRQNDMAPFLSLMRRYANSSSPIAEGISSALHRIELRNTYQKANYKGDLQGTQTGMILFYTDLLAKLWALDYKGSAPKNLIKGFRSIQETTVPKLYWDDFVRLSQTRLWFALRQDGFDVYGDKVLFQPIATRVYSASSDPLYPGKESLANYQSREFLGWWDRHFDAVADYEPYYHKLNQVQKWSCIFMLLREKKSQHLDYLLTVPIVRTIDFEAWLKDNEKLKSTMDIQFLDRRKFGHTAECLPLLSSDSYRIMGRDFVVRGGVSLASRKDILKKLHEHAGDSFAASNIPLKEHVPSPADKSGAQRPLMADRPPVAAPDHKNRMGRQQKAQSSGQIEPENLSSPGHSLNDSLKRGMSAGDYGTFSADKQQGAIRLKWNKGPAVAADEFVASLAALQQAKAQAVKAESIFSAIPGIQSAVRVKEGQTYLIKTAATGNEWIYLSINPSEIAQYPAKASASFPEADIFCARLVSDVNARQLAAGKMLILAK